MARVTSVLTFISVATFLLLCHHRARRAYALKRSSAVDTFPSVTKARDGLTLVDVHALARVHVLQVTRLAIQPGRTTFTRVAPGNTWVKI